MSELTPTLVSTRAEHPDTVTTSTLQLPAPLRGGIKFRVSHGQVEREIENPMLHERALLLSKLLDLWKTFETGRKSFGLAGCDQAPQDGDGWSILAKGVCYCSLLTS